MITINRPDKKNALNHDVRSDLYEAMKLAEQISRGPAAIGFAKRAMNKALDLDSQSGIQLSSELYAKVSRTKDAREGIRAYLEKRKPRVEGR